MPFLQAIGTGMLLVPLSWSMLGKASVTTSNNIKLLWWSHSDLGFAAVIHVMIASGTWYPTPNVLTHEVQCSSFQNYKRIKIGAQCGSAAHLVSSCSPFWLDYTPSRFSAGLTWRSSLCRYQTLYGSEYNLFRFLWIWLLVASAAKYLTLHLSLQTCTTKRCFIKTCTLMGWVTPSAATDLPET